MTPRVKTLDRPITLKIGKKKVTVKKIEYASDKKVYKHPELLDEFMCKILGVRAYLVSDMSSIYDFDFRLDDLKTKHSTDKYIKKIQKVYGVDVSKIKGLYIYKIIDKIFKERTICQPT